MNIKRRTILVAAGAGALGAVAGATVMKALPVRNWDVETDVICVGSGAAGSTAAVIAASNGAKVIVFDKMPIGGGTTAKSGGVEWIFNNFAMREKGLVDEKPDALKYAVRYGFPLEYDPLSPTLGLDVVRFGVVEAFYDNGSKMIDRLRELGAVQFELSTSPGPDGSAALPFPDYGSQLDECKAPIGRSIQPVGDAGYGAGGQNLIACLHGTLNKMKVPIKLDSRVVELVQNDDGRVVGVVVDQAGALVRVKANKGVIFGSGGFAQNVELCKRHQPPLFGSCSLPGSTGDFIALASKAGAALGPLNNGWRSQVVLGEALQSRGVGLTLDVLPGDSMLLVNKYGRRCVNEKFNYNDRTKAHYIYDDARIEYSNLIQFMLFDARTLDRFGGNLPIPADQSQQPFLIEGADWKKLAENISVQLRRWRAATGGVDLSNEFVGNLEHTLIRFNEYAATGRDLDFRRGEFDFDKACLSMFAPRAGTTFPPNPYPNPAMHPLSSEGPYYCIVLAPGALDTAGGPQINSKAQVMGTDGNPIPGLYGAGNCIAPPTGQAYLGSGGTIGPGMTFGYIAGNEVMR